jgi:hypothetical protein
MISRIVIGLALLSLLYPGLGGRATADEPAADRSRILVELFLAAEQRRHLDDIKTTLASEGITRVRVQFFRLGHPPENLAIGPDVPADVARLAIRMAKRYNDDVKYLLAQYRFFPNHIAIATSAFDEASQIPITPENLARLADPALTTEQFHALYRQLTGEDQRRPTYLE